ncbi:uncharacterized protein K441DRAFT_674378 [Cenococcum geophilum 1.58]|uniref:uncharacterized protein n=1 Tax=Cenococcum geophilum 1.58 TaxID=794803 RepID=UPI00358E522C|nr:hypothetical protein K441DRAFT_674378 [Cenococcum geophilum 1.58]
MTTIYVSTDSATQVLASGFQGLAALASLFLTDAVEHNVLATHPGYGTVFISSLSALGLLGIVESCLKASLGLEGCHATGFNMDSMHGLFGYAAGESATGGGIVECKAVTTEFLPDAVRVQKKRKFSDTEKTPMMNDGGMRFRRAVNLGNRTRNAILEQSLRFFIAFCVISSGVTAWLLMVIPGPWDWVQCCCQ